MGEIPFGTRNNHSQIVFEVVDGRDLEVVIDLARLVTPGRLAVCADSVLNCGRLAFCPFCSRRLSGTGGLGVVER